MNILYEIDDTLVYSIIQGLCDFVHWYMADILCSVIAYLADNLVSAIKLHNE